MIYICKCGKNFSKSGNAATTGFRETGNCFGCPYLLPYGENYFDDVQRAVVLDIKGYECRASQFLRYQTELSVALDDKTTIRIESLDFDFLERVSNWVKEHYPDGELFGSFSREDIRSAEYTSDGRYRYSLSCSQNKKGIAAKRVLWAEFFDEAYHRTDMSAEEEKEKVLKDIQLGIERAKEAVLMHYKDENTGWVYRVSPQPGERDLYFIEYLDPASSVIFKRLPDYPGSKFKESAEEVLAARARRNGWAQTEPPEIEPAGSDLSDVDVPAGFDYSGLDAQTVADLHLAEREFAAGKRLAEMGLRRMAEGVAIAHEALCGELSQVGTTQKHGNRGEDTFKSWCESIGVSRSAAYRMLNVVNLFDESTPRQQKVLDALAPSVLYEASRPSAEPQAVEALKKGEITTLKQFKEMEAHLKEAQERAERAEREAQEAKEKAHRLETRPVMSELYDANQRIKELENRPIEVATQAPTEEQINEAAKPVIQEMTAMYKVQQEQQREQIKELKAIVAASRNAIPNACRAIAESCAKAFASGFEEFQAMAQDLSDDEYMNAVEPIFEACREILDSLEGADYVEG